MGFLKKLIVSLAVIIILLSLSYFPFDLGVFSLKFMKMEISAPTNFVLVALIVIWLGCSVVSVILRATRAIFKSSPEKIDKASENELINLLFIDKFSEIENPTKYEVSEKYKILKEAIKCSLFEKFNKYHQSRLIPLNYNKDITILIVHQIKLNIQKYLAENNIKAALLSANEVIDKYPSHVVVIKDQILEISKTTKLDFDPKKYKYNLSKEYVDKYYEVSALRDFSVSRNISVLEKAHKICPYNVILTFELIKNSPNIDDKKVISMIKECFSVSPDRFLAYAILNVKKRDTLFETATYITEHVQNCNIEKLWFLCIVATEMGHIAKGTEILKTIMREHPKEVTKIEKFFILNHSKFASNIELLQQLKEIIKNDGEKH